MVRPKASQHAKSLATAFASVVTKFTNRQEDLVARSGEFSIFELFAKLIPKVTMLCTQVDLLSYICEML